MKSCLLKYAFYVFIYISCFKGIAQTYKINGKIIDKDSQEPLEYANIILKPLDTNSIALGGITDENGEFNFRVPKGVYTIQIEFISFIPYVIDKKEINKNTYFGVIALDEDSQAIEEVEIVSNSKTVRLDPDKKVYSVSTDLTAQGGSASDILANVPSVSVDVEGNLSLRGDESVLVLINGKPSGLVGLNSADALSQIPSDAIERVEVITNPSARYDAEGTAGIINIILKKGVEKGWNYNFSTDIGVPKNIGLAGNVNYRTSDFNFYSNSGTSLRKYKGESLVEQTNLENTTTNRYLYETREFNRNRDSYYTNTGLNYSHDDYSELNINFLYKYSPGSTNSKNTLDYYNAQKKLTQRTLRLRDDNRIDHVLEYTLNYELLFDREKQRLYLDLQYQDNTEQRNENIYNLQEIPEEEYLPDQDEITSNWQKQNRFIIRADYTHPLNERNQIELGYKGTLNSQYTDYRLYLRDNYDNFILDSLTSNVLNYIENIHAFYGQWGDKKGSFSYLLGFRTELTDIKIDFEDTKSKANNAKKKYIELFPTINLGYDLSVDENISMNYSRRLSRPYGRLLNPFPTRSSPTNTFQGNIDLNPTFTQSFEISYLKKWEIINLNPSIFYQHSSGVLEFISEQNGQTPEGVPIINRTPINLSTENRIGLELNTSYNPFKWLSLVGDFNLFSVKRNGYYNEINFDSQSIRWFLTFNSKVNLPEKINFQTLIYYKSPFQTAQNKYKNSFVVNLAFSKKILEESGSLTLNVSDLLNSSKRRMTTNTNTTTSYNEFKFMQTQITLSFNYHFNNKGSIGKKNKD